VCVFVAGSKVKKTLMTKGQKNVGDHSSKVKKTLMTKCRKNVGELGSMVKC
jgi:hypothetical protein